MDKCYTFDVVNADDGTDDMVLQFTDEFIAEQGWRVDDVISFTKLENDSIMLTNKSLKERDGGTSAKAETADGSSTQ
jgi:hypothetical protein